MFHGYRCSSLVESPPRSPHYIQVVHATGGVAGGYRRLAKCSCPLTSVRDSYATLCHGGQLSMYLHSPYVTVLH